MGDNDTIKYIKGRFTSFKTRYKIYAAAFKDKQEDGYENTPPNIHGYIR
jgi:hypothetical protein